MSEVVWVSYATDDTINGVYANNQQGDPETFELPADDPAVLAFLDGLEQPPL